MTSPPLPGVQVMSWAEPITQLSPPLGLVTVGATWSAAKLAVMVWSAVTPLKV